ncbi:MAG: hypothetical protein D6705_04205 [Deltaproteobacteria bacterium]|nr:MAG: hypothetical protein D6705_04205 [Deltaproteobacteria bacterium]
MNVRLAWIALGGIAMAACRAGEGERCVCAADCKAGLVCALDNGSVLDEGTCSPDGAAGGGMCVPEGSQMESTSSGTGPPLFMDMGSKRDFEPPQPTSSASSASDTSGTATSTSTGTSG